MLYMYHTLFIHSSVNGHLNCFHALDIVTSATKNFGIRMSFSLMVFSGYMPSSGISGSYDSFIPRFLRNLYIVLQRGYINLHS